MNRLFSNVAEMNIVTAYSTNLKFKCLLCWNEWVFSIPIIIWEFFNMSLIHFKCKIIMATCTSSEPWVYFLHSTNLASNISNKNIHKTNEVLLLHWKVKKKMVLENEMVTVHEDTSICWCFLEHARGCSLHSKNSEQDNILSPTELVTCMWVLLTLAEFQVPFKATVTPILCWILKIKGFWVETRTERSLTG